MEQKDILIQMLKNNDETTDYFKISKRQAQSSLVFDYFLYNRNYNDMSIFKIDDMQFAIIGIVGETITELIAGIVLVIHNKSALQLNYYYDALHENEKFLSAINLVDKLEDTEKTQMYIEVIRAQIKQTRACSHKNSVKDHGKHNDGKKNGIQLIITGKNFTEAF